MNPFQTKLGFTTAAEASTGLLIDRMPEGLEAVVTVHIGSLLQLLWNR